MPGRQFSASIGFRGAVHVAEAHTAMLACASVRSRTLLKTKRTRTNVQACPIGASCSVIARGLRSAGIAFCGDAAICERSVASAKSIELTSARAGIAFPGRTRKNESENRNLERRPQTAGTLIAGPSKDELSFKPPSRTPRPWHAHQAEKLAGEEPFFN